MTTTKAPERTVRELLRRIGIGQFNATMIIPYMFIAPATTDPKAGQIMLLVEHLQHSLNALGAGIPVSGHVDQAMNEAMIVINGKRWKSVSWADNVQMVLDMLDAKATPFQITVPDEPPPEAVGFFDPPFLPEIPGGILTYGLAAYLIYRHLTKNKRA